MTTLGAGALPHTVNHQGVPGFVFLAACRLLALCLFSAPLIAQSAAPATAPATLLRQDAVLRAMVDEVSRTRQLTMVVGAPLYFANYMFAKGDSFLISASQGALLNRLERDMRVPTVSVRVGNYASDDTNFVASGIYQGTRFSADRFPLDDNYLAMRRSWWLLTDMQYKGSAQSLNLKRASQQNLQITQTLPDFAKHDPTVLLLPISIASFDKSRWEQRVRLLSAQFKSYPQILDSQVQFGFSRGTEYLVNSEGSMVRRPFAIAFLRIVAGTLGTDHSPQWDSLEYLAVREEDFPSDDQMRKDLEALMERMVNTTSAPEGEGYRGPVLFEGIAAGQLVAQLVGRQLWIPRKPVMIPNRPMPWPRVELEGRLGLNVVSEKLTIHDDPTLRSFEGTGLIGHTEIDLEAVVPKPLTMIRDGKLETLFRTRTPSVPDEESNGRARIPGIFGANRGAPTNLLVEAADPVPEDSLKQKLIEMIVAAGKPYGMLIRNLDFPTTGPSDALVKIFGAASAAQGKVRVSLPLAAYRVYPDGREELVRKLNFRDLELRALRDLAAAGDRKHLFQYLENGALFAQMGTGSYVGECSIISPSLLLEEVELEPITIDTPNPPLVEPPALSAGN